MFDKPRKYSDYQKTEIRKNSPGDNSETGVLDGVGLCPGGRKFEGDPLLEPP